MESQLPVVDRCTPVAVLRKLPIAHSIADLRNHCTPRQTTGSRQCSVDPVDMPGLLRSLHFLKLSEMAGAQSNPEVVANPDVDGHGLQNGLN